MCTGHSDIPGPSECYPRIKTMLYLTPTTKERGAIRFIAGSHTPEYQQQLKRVQGWHGIHTTHPLWAQGTFGVSGPELPSVAIESSVGDFVIFHHSLCTPLAPLAPPRLLSPPRLIPAGAAQITRCTTTTPIAA